MENMIDKMLMSLPTFDINPDDLVVRMSDKGEYTPFLCLCDDSKWLLYWSDGDDNYYSPVKEENTPTEAIQKAYDYCVEQGWIKKGRTMNREEIWKDILGYEGFYQVSNLGRVRSVDRIVKGSFGSQHKKSIILAPAINTAGYYSVALTRNAKGKTFRVHRLVAEAFIPNPGNYPIINHKDENKLNNNVNNLEWCTYSYNTVYNNSMARRQNAKNKNHSYGCEKKVYQYDINGHLIKIWKSLMEVSRELHIPWGNIANCCRGGKYRHTAYGYKWSYKSINTL